MAKNYGPDRIRVPELGDIANVPADLVAMLQSMRAQTVGVANDQFDRDRKYSVSGANTVDAPAGMLCVAPSMGTLWMKTGPGIQWATLVGPNQEAAPNQTITVGASGSSPTPNWGRGPTLTIPATGRYSLFCQAAQLGDSDTGTHMLQLFVGDEQIAGITQLGVGWWRAHCSRSFHCAEGAKIWSQVAHRSQGDMQFRITTSYMRIR